MATRIETFLTPDIPKIALSHPTPPSSLSGDIQSFLQALPRNVVFIQANMLMYFPPFLHKWHLHNSHCWRLSI